MQFNCLSCYKQAEINTLCGIPKVGKMITAVLLVSQLHQPPQKTVSCYSFPLSRALSRVKLSHVHKEKEDKHNLCPHNRSMMPEVTLETDPTPTRSSTPRMFFHSLAFYCQADMSEVLRIIRQAECVNTSMKE